MVAGNLVRRRRVLGVLALLAVAASACGPAAALPRGEARSSPAPRVAYVAAFGDPAEPGALVPRVGLHPLRTLRPLATTAAQAAVVGTWHADLVVLGEADDQLVVLSPGGRVLRRVVVGLEPDALAVRGDLALVADSGSGQLQGVDLQTGRVLWSVAVGAVPDALAVAGSSVLVADLASGRVVAVSLVSHRVTASADGGPEPDALAVAGSSVLVADLGADQVLALDLPGLSQGPRVAVPFDPTGLALGPGPAGTPVAWAVGGAALVPLRLPGLLPGPAIPLGHVAEALALGPGGRTAWVAEEDGFVAAVNLATGRVLGRTYVGGRPSALALGPSPA
ncbi:YncE family protein [Aciditerrimonas ferrireducens]|uniref:YncE family protein n=1 Tax=Aciditerrimonas ferrireducens TaxID=667306 RepID=A0ABV6C6L4_9ACTN